ncbi:MAG: fructose bisphosphate aldolase [Rhodobacteraceae bacterium]|nr:fructose bisphosphate aldolase [Paracoccaceae bacterium]
MDRQHQREKIKAGKGFVAALDQSGGSTPGALHLYGIAAQDYHSDAQMFDLIHAMRARIIQAPAFTGARIIGAILFDMTMERSIDGMPSARYLWEKRGIVPFLKVDKGLDEAHDGARLLKPIAGLDALLDRALAHGIFGTKMRSVIEAANAAGIRANVEQQFAIGQQILRKGLVPILEPEVSITIPDKAEAEHILRDEILAGLERLESGQEIMLKLSLPDQANFYQPLVAHPQVLRVVALSGGYSRAEANARLAQNGGVVASFSRALAEGLSVGQSDTAFQAALSRTIDSIYQASLAG